MRRGESSAAAVSSISVRQLRKAASNSQAVNGLTHTFYRYPARFSPAFVASAIEQFSTPGQLVLDPYMGGGTTIVEAFARNRKAVGCDLNSLAVFVTRAKTSRLEDRDQSAVSHWATHIVPTLSYHTVTDELAELICPYRTKNLALPRSRPAKKLMALAMLSLNKLTSVSAQNFARAVLLNVAQWALNNREEAPSLARIRARISSTCNEMSFALIELEKRRIENGPLAPEPVLIQDSAVELPFKSPFVNGEKVDLVVTSPPYPGIHILYHRWQVDGRKETPAPYWIAGCYDGKGASFYNFADRREQNEDAYFIESLKTLCSVRKIMRDGALMIQLIAFSNPKRQLPRYLENMTNAGFAEVREATSEGQLRAFRRIWRVVPSRAWYANLKGKTNSSREVVLLHRAI